MMRKLSLILLIAFEFIAQNHSQEIVHLYEGKAPGSENWNYSEIVYSEKYTNLKMVRNVVDPTLEVFLPEDSIATGTSVVICPGGGNVWLSYENEGTAVAEWLVKKGITAFVLKYRLHKTPEDPKKFEEFSKTFMSGIKTNKTENTKPGESEELHYYGGEDGMKAIQYVRDHAEKYKINPNKIGIIGFSAGAGVCMYVIQLSEADKQPNFVGLIYGGWLKDEKLSDSAPPAFILCAADDPIATNSPDLYKAWKDAGKSAELHIYSKGGHGFGMTDRRRPVNKWIERFYDWLLVSGFK